MLVETKAKVGVFSIALGAYLPQFPSLVPEFEAQYDAFKKTLPDTVEIIDGGMVTTKEQSQAAGDLFRAADVDLVFLQLLTYATSYNMLPAVKDLDVPVVLVNIQKLKALDYDHTDIASWLGEGYACGAVGEMVADLERYGKRHAVITGVVEGGDPGVQAEINDWCRAAQVRRRFRDTNIAQIGRPYQTYTEECTYIQSSSTGKRCGQSLTTSQTKMQFVQRLKIFLIHSTSKAAEVSKKFGIWLNTLLLSSNGLRTNILA